VADTPAGGDAMETDEPAEAEAGAGSSSSSAAPPTPAATRALPAPRHQPPYQQR
jgi:hypothetical protein